MSNRVAKTAVLLAFSTLTALAVAADPPARVGRVALAQGQVTIGSDIGAEMMAALGTILDDQRKAAMARADQLTAELAQVRAELEALPDAR